MFSPRAAVTSAVRITAPACRGNGLERSRASCRRETAAGAHQSLEERSDGGEVSGGGEQQRAEIVSSRQRAPSPSVFISSRILCGRFARGGADDVVERAEDLEREQHADGHRLRSKGFESSLSDDYDRESRERETRWDVCPQRQCRSFAFRYLTRNYGTFPVSDLNDREFKRLGSVAFQNTVDRPRQTLVSTTLKNQRNSK